MSTTKNINVSVTPYYLEEQSEPEEQHFVWAYQVTINNLGQQTVQLKKRYWKIIDSNGSKKHNLFPLRKILSSMTGSFTT